MDLNITNIIPSLPNSNAIETYTSNETCTQFKTIKPKTGCPDNANNINSDITDAAIINISPEALKKSQSSEDSKNAVTRFPKTPNNQDKQELDAAEKKMVQELQRIDLHVKAHEQQHLASAGSYARGGASFQYTKGPDGKLYAVGGEVALDSGPKPNNPQATIIKAQVLRRAALAPSDPSGADRSVAAAATQMEAQARSELFNEKNKKSVSHSETDPTKTRNNSHYYIKAYGNSKQLARIGYYFNKIA